jgi:nondiscriminating glutamyl-tRNA synthetase
MDERVYIRECDLDRITDLTIPFIVRAGLMSSEEVIANRKWLRRAIDLRSKGSGNPIGSAGENASLF